MPKVNTTPKMLRPFQFHGVNFECADGISEAIGDCPWCGKEGKFSVNIETGQWRCFVCQEGTDRGGGNVYTFLSKLLQDSLEATSDRDREELADSRGLIDARSLEEWSVAKSTLTDNFLVPGFSPDGKLRTLYQWRKQYGKDRFVLMPTPTLGHHLYGVNLFDSEKSDIYLCEGFWDAVAWWEILRRAKKGKWTETANESLSELADCNVLAVPGCSVFSESWAPLFSEKKVLLSYDNDHPRKHPNTGTLVDGAGLAGMRRVTRILSKCKHPPSEILCLRWSNDGVVNKNIPNGFDIGGYLAESTA